MRYVAHSGPNITIQERRTTRRLAKEDPRKMSLSEWSSFSYAVKLVQQDVLSTAYSILGFKPLQNYHVGISKLMKEYTLTYLKSDAIRSHPKKSVHEKGYLEGCRGLFYKV